MKAVGAKGALGGRKSREALRGQCFPGFLVFCLNILAVAVKTD